MKFTWRSLVKGAFVCVAIGRLYAGIATAYWVGYFGYDVEGDQLMKSLYVQFGTVNVLVASFVLMLGFVWSLFHFMDGHDDNYFRAASVRWFGSSGLGWVQILIFAAVVAIIGESADVMSWVAFQGLL